MRFNQENDNFSEGVTVVAPVRVIYDETANDSDKSWTVPAGEMWKVCQAFVGLVTTATVGNRQVRFQVADSNGKVIGFLPAGAVQAASQTRSYGFLQGIYRETAFLDTMIQVPIPIDLYLKAGSVVRFWDSAAIDAAADDMTVSMTVQVFKGC